MNENITIQVSAKIYWGFKHYIDKKRINFMTYEDIVRETKEKMKQFFEENNLLELKEGIDKLNLYIHDLTGELSDNDIIYLCDHC
jgi:hypothetical protein